jgi:hypothetical protein
VIFLCMHMMSFDQIYPSISFFYPSSLLLNNNSGFHYSIFIHACTSVTFTLYRLPSPSTPTGSLPQTVHVLHSCHSCFCIFSLDTTYDRKHVVFVFLNLAYLLNMMISSSTHFLAKSKCW